MSRTLMQSRQIAVQLSLNVYRTSDDSDQVTFSIVPLISLTRLLLWLWAARQQVNRIRFNVTMIARRLTDRIDTAAKVATIGFRSIAWGVMNL